MLRKGRRFLVVGAPGTLSPRLGKVVIIQGPDVAPATQT